MTREPGYESWIRVFILPRWANAQLTELQARPVEMWLDSLSLAPKSKVHIRGILSSLWNFAMWKQDVPMQVNPITLVTVKGASKRIRQPRSLTVEQFRLLVSHLREPFNTMALMCVCFGLRISEALALKWGDVDWLNGTLRVERGIVEQIVDDVKTEESRKSLTIADDLLEVLKAWKQTTQFSANRIGFLPPLSSRQTALLLHGIKAGIATRGRCRGLGHLGATLSGTRTARGWIRGYADRSTTETYASRGHPHHDEHLRRRCHA